MLRGPDRLVPMDISRAVIQPLSQSRRKTILIQFVGVHDEGEYEGHSSVGIRDAKHQV